MSYVFEIGSSGICEKHGIEREVDIKIGMPYNTGIWGCPKCDEESFKILRDMEYQNIKKNVKTKN